MRKDFPILWIAEWAKKHQQKEPGTLPTVALTSKKKEHIEHITCSAPGIDSDFLHLTFPLCFHPRKVPEGEGALAQQCVALPVQGLDMRIAVHVGDCGHFIDIKIGIRCCSIAITANAAPFVLEECSVEYGGTLAQWIARVEKSRWEWGAGAILI